MDIQKELEKHSNEINEKICQWFRYNTKYKVYGCFTKTMEMIAKELIRTNEYKSFLKDLPHNSYEENNIHGYILGYLKNENIVDIVSYLEDFFPYIDNWATCDGTASRLKIVRKNSDFMLKTIKKWLKSEKTFIKRFAIVLLMSYFLDDEFNAEYLFLFNKENKNDYYIDMAIAWFYSVALVKQYKDTVRLFEQHTVSNVFIRNKSIQKAIESYRISKDKKDYLKTLRI